MKNELYNEDLGFQFMVIGDIDPLITARGTGISRGEIAGENGVEGSGERYNRRGFI